MSGRPGQGQLSVVIVDDEPLAREGLAESIERLVAQGDIPAMSVVASCDTAAAAAQTIRESAPDIALVDIQMSVTSGLEMPLPGAQSAAHKMSFHHFHNRDGSDRLLISMPRMDIPGDRQILAELAFEVPRDEAGTLDIVHPRLAPVTLRSRQAEQQSGHAVCGAAERACE